MSLTNFIKKLLILDVIWGKRSKVLHGIKDGGALATQIADPSRAKVYNDATIFNVNNALNECAGGHYHSADQDPTEICLSFEFSDWVNNQITVISTGIPGPGQIGPHGQTSTCLMTKIYQKINVPSPGSFKEVDIQIIIDNSNKNIIMLKAAKPAQFSGKIIIDAK